MAMMQAVVFKAPYKLAVETVPCPTLLEETDAIVKISSCGLCGSDLHPYRGAEDGLDVGTIMGHEFVGEIFELGANVQGLQIGDRVGSGFTTCCGECWYCQRGITCRCEKGQLYGWISNGHGLHGAQAQFIRVPLATSSLLKLPTSVSDDEALLLGDIFSTGYFCAKNGFSALQNQTSEEAVAVVVGCGPVGIMAVVGVIDLGCKTVYAVDSIPERLELARKFGAIPVHLTEGEPVEVIKRATNGRGADVVLEVVGHPSALSLSYSLLRPSGVLSSVGVHTAATFPFSPSQGYDKNLTYRSGRCPSRAMMERLLPVVEQRRYDLAGVISHRVGLTEAVEMYANFEGKVGGCTKVVFKPWE
ncbi:chaperonin 10-like protein [Endogone sp. FLAS-F59071]|nr:chaperonin 10-like protein [Endogone sp. FLAS-F59071]|eukprot:RUS20986.1 chaperonin 10-like protein [Endogone sp. FLAS-F59071]